MENTLLPWRYVGKEFSHNRIQRMAHFEGQNRPKALKKKRRRKKEKQGTFKRDSCAFEVVVLFHYN